MINLYDEIAPYLDDDNNEAHDKLDRLSMVMIDMQELLSKLQNEASHNWDLIQSILNDLKESK